MFYENFARVCKERHTSPSRACIDAGLGVSRASNWKKSGALPKQDELEKLANVLKCDVADFFRSETVPRFHTAYDALAYRQAVDDSGAETAPLSEDEDYVVTLMRAMTKRQRALFMVSVYDFEEAQGVEP